MTDTSRAGTGLRVLVDATAIPADRGGVGRYVDALLPALADAGLDLVVTVQAGDAELMSALVPDAEIIAAPRRIQSRPARLAWEQAALPRIVARTRSQVLHSPHYTMPWAVPRGVPRVVTVHDATFFSHPELHSPTKRRFFRTAVRFDVARADAVVVPSAATRDEVLRYVGGVPERFHVAYHGVDARRFYPADKVEQARVRASLHLGDRPFIAFLGTLEPRKNVPALIRAWVRCVQDMHEPPVLVLAGGQGWDTEIAPALAAVPAGLSLVTPGYLPLGDLAGFLAAADVVAYPSLGEGFGLPVLEAMACGAPVLTTRELALPEVGGDAVAYSGVDEVSIARVLGRLLADGVERKRLASAGVERAAGFTWARAAASHVVAYESALGALVQRSEST